MAKVKKGHTIGDLRRVSQDLHERWYGKRTTRGVFVLSEGIKRGYERGDYGSNPSLTIDGVDSVETVLASLRNFLAYADRQPAKFTDDYVFSEAK